LSIFGLERVISRTILLLDTNLFVSMKFVLKIPGMFKNKEEDVFKIYLFEL
jgi:hypothetical protein